MWSFGVVCYEVMAQLPPWHNVTPAEAAIRTLKGERLALPPCTPDYLKALVLDKCWQTLPQQRASMELVRQTLADAVRCARAVRCRAR